MAEVSPDTLYIVSNKKIYSFKFFNISIQMFFKTIYNTVKIENTSIFIFEIKYQNYNIVVLSSLSLYTFEKNLAAWMVEKKTWKYFYKSWSTILFDFSCRLFRNKKHSDKRYIIYHFHQIKIFAYIYLIFSDAFRKSIETEENWKSDQILYCAMIFSYNIIYIVDCHTKMQKN